MSQVRSLLSALMALVGPFSLVFLGAGIALALVYNGEADTEGRAGRLRSGRATVSDDGNTVDVNLDVAKGDSSTKLVVGSEEGEELATFYRCDDGTLRFESIESDPIRFIFQRNRSKSVEFGLNSGRTRFVLHAQPDGSTDLFVQGTTQNRPYRVRVTSEGNVVSHVDVPAL